MNISNTSTEGFISVICTPLSAIILLTFCAFLSFQKASFVNLMAWASTFCLNLYLPFLFYIKAKYNSTVKLTKDGIVLQITKSFFAGKNP
jgi:hypothetical protein